MLTNFDQHDLQCNVRAQTMFLQISTAWQSAIQDSIWHLEGRVRDRSQTFVRGGGLMQMDNFVKKTEPPPLQGLKTQTGPPFYLNLSMSQPHRKSYKLKFYLKKLGDLLQPPGQKMQAPLFVSGTRCGCMYSRKWTVRVPKMYILYVHVPIISVHEPHDVCHHYNYHCLMSPKLQI